MKPRKIDFPSGHKVIALCPIATPKQKIPEPNAHTPSTSPNCSAACHQHRDQSGIRELSEHRAMQAQVKEILRKYGRTAFVFHASLFATTLSGSYAAIRYGVDIEKYLHKVPFIDLTSLDPNAGTLALAYVSTLATGPARGAVTIGVTPILARWLARQGKLLGSASGSAMKKPRP